MRYQFFLGNVFDKKDCNTSVYCKGPDVFIATGMIAVQTDRWNADRPVDKEFEGSLLIADNVIDSFELACVGRTEEVADWIELNAPEEFPIFKAFMENADCPSVLMVCEF